MSDEIDYKGTNGNDYINERGNGKIDAGKGKDTVVLSEGDFFDISGFEDSDVPGRSKSQVESHNKLRDMFGTSELLAEQDQLLIFIDPENEEKQSVQYFERGGVTYVRLYDKDSGETLGGARLKGTGLNIKIGGENGNLGMRPERISIDEEFQNSIASNINEGIAKGYIDADDSMDNLQQNFKDYIEEQVDKGHNSSNPFDRLASKFYELQKDRER